MFFRIMAKTTAAAIIAAGFAAEQFGADAVADFDAYLAPLIADAGTWAESAVGAAGYAAATSGIALLRLERAELCYCKAELWRRRAAVLDSNASGALQEGQYLERREYLAHAREAAECADDWLSQAVNDGAHTGSGAGMVFAESGPFTVSDTAVNA